MYFIYLLNILSLDKIGHISGGNERERKEENIDIPLRQAKSIQVQKSSSSSSSDSVHWDDTQDFTGNGPHIISSPPAAASQQQQKDAADKIPPSNKKLLEIMGAIMRDFVYNYNNNYSTSTSDDSTAATTTTTYHHSLADSDSGKLSESGMTAEDINAAIILMLNNGNNNHNNTTNNTMAKQDYQRAINNNSNSNEKWSPLPDLNIHLADSTVPITIAKGQATLIISLDRILLFGLGVVLVSAGLLALLFALLCCKLLNTMKTNSNRVTCPINNHHCSGSSGSTCTTSTANGKDAISQKRCCCSGSGSESCGDINHNNGLEVDDRQRQRMGSSNPGTLTLSHPHHQPNIALHCDSPIDNNNVSDDQYRPLLSAAP